MRRSLLGCWALMLAVAMAQINIRPPATPLVTSSPFVNHWLMGDTLTGDWMRYWGGTVKALFGMIAIDGTVYRFMGPEQLQSGPPALPQIARNVTATSSYFVFSDGHVQLKVTFTTPSIVTLPLEQLSRPVTYLDFDVQSVDNQKHQVQVYYDNTAEIAINSVTETVAWNKVEVPDSNNRLTVLRIGTSLQPILQESGDNIGIDWGYFYIATPTPANSAGFQYTMNSAQNSRGQWASQRTLPQSDMVNIPRAAYMNWPVLAFSWDFSVQPGQSVNKYIALAYDDLYSIKWFGAFQRPYWRKDPNTRAQDMLADAIQDHDSLISQAATFDAQLYAKLLAAGGVQYAELALLGYRQVMAGIQIVYNDEEQVPWVYMKEISSDGDLSTVDVIYPAAPFFLSLTGGHDLLRMMMYPLLKYANNETSIPYTFAWAPHHLGYYPIGYIFPSQQENMPIEETGNMVVMLAALGNYYGNFNWIFPKYLPLIESWGQYLISSLPDPGNQLCTDDFEGPSPHNANLAAKGIVALGAMSKIYTILGNATKAATYTKVANAYVANWTVSANDGNHFRLEYDKPNTWSIKYNLLFQKVLGIHVFPESVFKMEFAYYQTKLNQYGVPLDNRATFAKLDWQCWIAAMSYEIGNVNLYNSIINAIYQWASATPNRVPMTDWYDTISAKQMGFTARPVVGGIYAHLLLRSPPQRNQVGI